MRQLIVKQGTDVRTYKGRTMRCTTGVHEEVAHLVAKRVPGPERESVRVLDLGAGTGALTQRILDLGFTSVTAWDLDPDQLTDLRTITIDTVDLNEDFGKRSTDSGMFEIVLAVEIIEHLENPYHFVRQLKQLLKPDGFAIITTPNIESAASRISFLRTGFPRWFGDYFYEDSGHISALTFWQLNKAVERAGLQIVEKSHNLHNAVIVRDPGPLSTYRAALTAALFYPLMHGNRDGDIHVLSVQHPPAASKCLASTRADGLRLLGCHLQDQRGPDRRRRLGHRPAARTRGPRQCARRWLADMAAAEPLRVLPLSLVCAGPISVMRGLTGAFDIRSLPLRSSRRRLP